MSARTTGAEAGVSVVSLLNAVFCSGCENISNSPHDVCAVCGSHSLTSLSRLLGGKLRSERVQAKTAKYNVELTAKIHEIVSAELDYLLHSITRLAEGSGDLERLHINVETVFDTAGLKAA